MTEKKLIVCKRCLMDTSAEDIQFDENGFCNFCNKFLNETSKILNIDKDIKNKNLNSFLNKIKTDGKNKKYDCIVGVSGGVDSSYTLIKAKEFGLRPLAVHMDNGWNSELAQNNISNLVNALKVDLYTHVIEWEEYRNLMLAFFDANVLDIELLYDNAMMAVNFQLAKKYGIKYILSGVNTSTEGVEMPIHWNWFKYDKLNIKNIGLKFRNVKLVTFPSIGTIDFIKYKFLYKIKWYSFLDYIEYDKNEAIELLKNNFNYKPYPYKHYEGIFTRFYQGFILPNKFGIDKRKLHLSTLVLTNQIKRDEAIDILRDIPYPSLNDLENDKIYFLKKIGWNDEKLEKYLKEPGIPHDFYKSEKKLWEKLILGQNNSKIFKLLKKIALRIN
jgi:N-acetyl sugar amidotransferase